MDRSPTQEIPFSEGAPQQRQDNYHVDERERELLDLYRSDPDVRFQADALAYQRRNGIPAGQYQRQQAQPQEPQETELERRSREYQEKIVPRMRELENWANSGRHLSPEELAEYERLRMQETQAFRDMNALERQETQRARQEVQIQNERQQLEAHMGQRIYDIGERFIEPMHVPVVKKKEFYQRLGTYLRNHPFYYQIRDTSAADVLVDMALKTLLADDDVPKQRRTAAGRQGEQYNDVDTPQPEAKGPWAHLPEGERNTMAELYPHRAKVAN